MGTLHTKVQWICATSIALSAKYCQVVTVHMKTSYRDKARYLVTWLDGWLPNEEAKRWSWRDWDPAIVIFDMKNSYCDKANLFMTWLDGWPVNQDARGWRMEDLRRLGHCNSLGILEITFLDEFQNYTTINVIKNNFFWYIITLVVCSSSCLCWHDWIYDRWSLFLFMFSYILRGII